MTRVKVSKDAADFVRSEAAYLRRRNPHAARSFADTVRRAKEVLRTFVDAGNVTHVKSMVGLRLSSMPTYSTTCAKIGT